MRMLPLLLLVVLALVGCEPDVDGPGPIPPTTIPPPAYAAQVFVGSPNAPYDFQAVEIGQTKRVDFSILNTLAAGLEVRVVMLGFPLPGTPPGPYAYTLIGAPSLPVTLLPQATIEFAVEFAPHVAATYPVWLTIIYAGGREDIPLTGVGTP